jgi:hypothetical protein
MLKRGSVSQFFMQMGPYLLAISIRKMIGLSLLVSGEFTIFKCCGNAYF